MPASSRAQPAVAPRAKEGGEDSRPWILWDGDCGICRRSADWIRRQDRRKIFRISSWQKAPSPPMTPALRKSCPEAVHVVTADGRVLRAGRASLHILRTLGWPVGLLARRPFIGIVERVYAFVARHRSHTGCPLPPR